MSRVGCIIGCLMCASTGARGQTEAAPSFEAATIKPSPPSAQRIECSGGPGTSSPGIWRCLNVPLFFVITRAYDFEAWQFPPNHICCRDRFDFTARLPERTTKEQFRRMLQQLLAERFKLALHRQQKEMPVYELTVAERDSKMKEAQSDAPSPTDPWEITPYHAGKDGYPVFPPGRAGLAGPNGHYRWVGLHLSMAEIVKTLSFHLGRPVVDTTGLKAKYDIDLKWSVDGTWLLERAGRKDEIENLPDSGPVGPNLLHAVQDQLGLKLISKSGHGDIVVIDHVEKVPIQN